MRCLSIIVLSLLGAVYAGEQQGNPAYPLWDGHESVEQYAKRVNLPATQSLDLGNGVKLELVLIPAGMFIMGTPEPTPVDDDAFRRKIYTGLVLFIASATALLGLLARVVKEALRKKRRPQISLGSLILLIVLSGCCLLSGLHWRQSTQRYNVARAEHKAVKARYDIVSSEETPAHPVTLTHPFYMGKFVVTQEQYQQVMRKKPSTFKGTDHPVETVSWDDAYSFCKTVTQITLQTVRLPTEAEWEYACRAGTQTNYYAGDSESDLARVAWYGANSNIIGTHPVGQKEPNGFGLFDMHGNVFQWCGDWYGGDYYRKSEEKNPQGPTWGAVRISRGGSSSHEAMYCRSAHRDSLHPDQSRFFYGFRVVAELLTKP